MTSVGISAHNVAMSFERNGVETQVLDWLSIDVPTGSFVSLLGPSGCGKSTLLKILGGILEPTAGTVEIGEGSALEAVAQRQIGLVLQRPALLPWKTARENVSLLREVAKGKDAKATDRALELVGLTEAAHRLPHELSGGMAQRISIARALAMDPTILLMDEPFGALDAITRDQMNEKLAEIWATTGKTIVFVTHSITEAVLLSDFVCVMGVRPGRIIERLEIELPRPRSSKTFEARRFGEYTAQLRERLHPGVGQEVPA